MSSTTPMSAPASTERRRAIAAALGIATFLTVMLVAFALPALKSAPRDVPLAIVAPDGVAQQLEAGLDQAQPGAFDVTIATDPDAARALIENRDVYGALVVGQDALTVEIASAASPAVAQIITGVGQALAAQTGVEATVEDVVPTSADDPRAIGLSAGALPIALGGLAAGVALTQLAKRPSNRLIGLATFAVAAGFAMTAVLEFWFGTFTGDYWVTSLVAILGILATGMTVLGLERLLGRAGIGLSALLIVLIGNPLSGLMSAPEMLPQPWGAIGQLLPPGATGTMLRNVAFFDGAAIAMPLTVLLVWLAIGLGAFALAGVLHRRRGAAPQA
ncbi:ABC transporter permease [Demequina sp.]|uniref:ABC transporter permease n=1 Tax=Demequina sp. TaxID=2050685 RepID=UPI0025D7A7C5|nr:ABC transporter permease [Demequina sp.]